MQLLGRRVSIFVLSLLISSSAFGWDYFAYVFDEVEIGETATVEGTLAFVVPFGGGWLATIYTCVEVDGYHQGGPVGVIFKRRPKNWNPGTQVIVTCTFNGTWENGEERFPTFIGDES